LTTAINGYTTFYANFVGGVYYLMFVLIVNFELLKSKLLIAFAPYYIRLSLIGGSIVLWIYAIQVLTGYLLAMIYPWLFDLGIPGMFILW